MTRSVLQGFLCARDISLEGIASLLDLELDVVKLYEGLLFNVRNREGSYALNAIFPQTRLGAVREAELDCNEVDLTLMRVGRDYGWKAVAQLAGLLSIEDGAESTETILTDMERTMAANARMLARAGHLNRKDSAGIRHGKALMMRAKKEAEINLGNDLDSRLGLGSFGMKAPVLEHFRRIMDTDSQYRLALQRDAAMGQLAKTAAVAKAAPLRRRVDVDERWFALTASDPVRRNSIVSIRGGSQSRRWSVIPKPCIMRIQNMQK